jgi:hypothetical protein
VEGGRGRGAEVMTPLLLLLLLLLSPLPPLLLLPRHRGAATALTVP